MSDSTAPSRKRKKTLNASVILALVWRMQAGLTCVPRADASTAESTKSSAAARSLATAVCRKGSAADLTRGYVRDLEARAAAPGHLPTPTTSLQQASAATSPRNSRTSVLYQPGERAGGPVDSNACNAIGLDQDSSRSRAERRLALSEEVTGDADMLTAPLLHPLANRHTRGQEAVVSDSQVAVGDSYRQLGHSSSWSFSRRVRELIRSTENGCELHDAVPIRDGAYGLMWDRRAIDLTNLDLLSPEYAEYLLSTISFSVGPLYYLFDKAKFLKKLAIFYKERDAGTASMTDPWLIQMLAVFALGTSLTSREAGASGPSGHAYFARAVDALPDMHRLCENSILSIETLCVFALFLEGLDLRLAAYGYVGNAISLCLAFGLNRKHDAARITHSEFLHRSKLFWTAYVIDRRLSSLIGVPSKLHDEDIGLAKPIVGLGGDGTQNIMAFHVELSSQLGNILDVVYGLGLQRQLGSGFVHSIQTILKRLSDMSRLLQEKLSLQFETTPSHKTRAIASLHVLHHKCAILAIRPVLFFVFERKIGHGHHGSLSGVMHSLLRVCTEAALGIQVIMDKLSAHRLIDLIFPHDLEALFASAFVLVLIDIITASRSMWDINKTFQIMDGMALRGLRVVEPYKKDLVEIARFRQATHHSENLDQSPQGRLSDAGRQTISNVAIEAAPGHDDCLWGDDSAVPVEQQDTFECALELINYNFPDDIETSDMDPYSWIWDSELIRSSDAGA